MGFWEGPILEGIIALGGLDTRPKAGSGCCPIPLKKKEEKEIATLKGDLPQSIRSLLKQVKTVPQAAACQFLLLTEKTTEGTGLPHRADRLDHLKSCYFTEISV